MKAKKKNKFLTFCFSLIPGAGEMYMGFMKTGVSLMLIFFASILLPAMLQIGAFAVICVVIWFYAFFHTNHLSSLSDEEFDQIEDEYLFGLDVMDKGKDVVKQYNSWIAYALIVVGCFVLWNTGIKLSWIILPSFIYEKIWRLNSYLPSIIVSLVVILLGIRMLKGKNNFIEGEKEDEWNKD